MRKPDPAAQILSDLGALLAAQTATEREVSQLLKGRGLWGRGLGWTDMHLLASALISNCRLWTLDKRLHKAAVELGAA